MWWWEIHENSLCGKIIILNRDFQQISFDHQTVVVCEHPSYLLFLGLILIQEVEDPEPNLCGLGALECFDKKKTLYPSVVRGEWTSKNPEIRDL